MVVTLAGILTISMFLNDIIFRSKTSLPSANVIVCMLVFKNALDPIVFKLTGITNSPLRPLFWNAFAPISSRIQFGENSILVSAEHS